MVVSDKKRNLELEILKDIKELETKESKEYFKSTVEFLSKALGFKYALIGEFVEDKKIKTIFKF